MDISFTHKTVPVYRELSRPVKRIQETAESVVPDTNEDIGRIASVHTAVLLKSKDLTSRGVSVTGEMEIVLLYITENENGVSFVRMKKDFGMEFELGQMQTDTLTQIRLTVGSTEARVLNPRKVAATVELIGELSCYRQEEMRVETLLPGSAEGLLHGRCEHGETTAVNAVCEKTFALNEQYRFPEGKPEPVQIVSQEASFSVGEVQQVGSRVVVKGTLHVDVCYLSGEVDYPLAASFCSPFSQIVDTGAEVCEGCTVGFELTSAYFDLVDTISGEKALDAEVHAVLQLVSRERKSVAYLSDVYCNRMPAECSCQTLALSQISERQRVRLEGEGEIPVAEDCEDVLCVFSSLAQLGLTDSSLGAAVGLDVIYRTKTGTLAAVRRLLEVEKAALPPDSRLLAGRLDGVDLRPEGGSLRCRAFVEADYQSAASREITDVTAVTLREEEAWRPEELPTVTLVRPDTEDLWELAKRYHSSVEGILALNGEDGAAGDLLLIPREA